MRSSDRFGLLGALGLLLASLGCGARSDLATSLRPDAAAHGAPQVDARAPGDATLHPPDASPPPEPDASPPPEPDASPPPEPDAGPPPKPDAGRPPAPDASPPPASDAGPPPTFDAKPPPVDAPSGMCPPSYPGEGAACSPRGAQCDYPQGDCTCSGACCGGPAVTCSALGVQCGKTVAFCGGPIDCGPCPHGQSCGGGGASGECGTEPDGFDCIVSTCNSPVQVCGDVGDGCGGVLHCPPCNTWSCVVVPQACPSAAPEKGAPCSQEGLECSYPQPNQTCCDQVLECSGGVWAAGPETCPA